MHGVALGFWKQGVDHTGGAVEDPDAVFAIDGQNLIIEYNTFVGLEDQLVGHRYGKGRTLRHNVIFGLPGRTQDAGWDSASYLKWWYVDFLNDGSVDSDNNCFIVPDQDFQHLAVYNGSLAHHSLEDSRSTFGLDQHSTVVVSSDPTEVFVDPAKVDYALKPDLPKICHEAGYLAPH